MAWEARSQYRGKPLTGPLDVTATIYYPNRRRRDVDNLKALYDAMSGILWIDDEQITDNHQLKRYDPENPRLELSVRELS
mgnify:CR=1 FL=1